MAHITSIRKQITPAECMYLRNQGMTNKEIAASLDCSYETIRLMIGKQPKGLRSTGSYTVDKKPEMIQSSQPNDSDVAKLMVVDRMIQLKGMSDMPTSYMVNYSDKKLDIAANGGSLSIDFDDLDTFIDELNAIRKKTIVFVGDNLW